MLPLANIPTSDTQVCDAPTREQILDFESKLREFPQLELQTDHTYGPGFYARTLHIPAGTLLTGKVHATEHIFFLSQGELVVITEDGRELIKAPYQKVCRPGMKRVGYALTDAVCTNIHITKETDLAKIEAEVIIPEVLLAAPVSEVLS